MKLSSKPISSPGRAEKYPPPLMRFLRSNVGSRSRGRSRSSPMFVRKKNTTIETQEPSSPKVTCMGQVRVRRSKQAGPKPSRPGAPTKRRRCKWIKNALFCHHHFTWKHKAKSSFRPSWSKWVSFFRVGFRRKNKTRHDFESKFGNKSENFEQENEQEEQDDDDDDEDEEEEAKVFVSTSTPPKNALLLMRCRSAPYKSSSLANRFWETEQEQENNNEEEEEEENPTSGSESICKDSDQESRMDPETEEKLGFFKEFQGSNSRKQNFVKSTNIVSIQDLKREATVRPVILTRCKSEPARTAEKKLGRLGLT